MLKTSTDFEGSINYLLQGINQNMSKGIIYQTADTNSEDFNATFDTIEKQLNTIYEKSRIMEDVINYAKEYVKSNIYNISKECRDILNEIEDDRDNIKDKAYISYSVPFTNSVGPYIDRDGTSLPETSTSNNTITLSGQIKTQTNIKSATLTEAITPYRNNISEISNGEPYRSFYILDGIVTGGIKEEIIIQLHSPTDINFIDLITSNCKVERIEYINENDTIEHDNKYIGTIIKDRKIKAIKIVLLSELYKKSVYHIDATRMVADFWDKVKENEYGSAIGTKTIYDFDQLSGLSDYAAAYNKYVGEMNSWITKTNEVYEQNKAIVAAYDSAYNSYVSRLSGWNSETGSGASPMAKSEFVLEASKMQALSNMTYESMYKDMDSAVNILLSKTQIATPSNPGKSSILDSNAYVPEVNIPPQLTRGSGVEAKLNGIMNLDLDKDLKYYEKLNEEIESKKEYYKAVEEEHLISIVIDESRSSKLSPIIGTSEDVKHTWSLDDVIGDQKESDSPFDANLKKWQKVKSYLYEGRKENGKVTAGKIVKHI
jgi:hypothetical protein